MKNRISFAISDLDYTDLVQEFSLFEKRWRKNKIKKFLRKKIESFCRLGVWSTGEQMTNAYQWIVFNGYITWNEELNRSNIESLKDINECVEYLFNELYKI